jgi:hypothetical protein
MPIRLAALFNPRTVRDLSLLELELLKAVRLAVICSQNGHDTLAILSVRCGGAPVAGAITALTGVMGDCWPEPIMIARPCCGHLTPDEGLLTDLIHAVALGDRSSFTAAAGDLITASRHDLLYRAIALTIARLAARTAAAH